MTAKEMIPIEQPQPMALTGPSVIERLPFEQYLDLPGEHSTSLRDVLVSPLLYNARQNAKRPDTNALRVGRACHTAVLEADRFPLEYAVWRSVGKDGKTRIRRGEAWETFCEATAGATILTEAQYNTALRVRDAVRNHQVAGRLLAEKGRSELTIRWTHERTGLMCKARLDWLCSSLVDVKSTRDPSSRGFSQSAGRFGYPMQLGFYADACAAVGLFDLPVKIIAAQNCEPFDVVVYEIDKSLLDHGRSQYEAALDKIVECRLTQEWPGIAPDAPVALTLPAWAAPEFDADAIDFGDAVIA